MKKKKKVVFVLSLALGRRRDAAQRKRVQQRRGLRKRGYGLTLEEKVEEWLFMYVCIYMYISKPKPTSKSKSI